MSNPRRREIERRIEREKKREFIRNLTQYEFERRKRLPDIIRATRLKLDLLKREAERLWVEY